MSTLQFIASIKWPITILVLVGFASWRLRRNPELGKTIAALTASRSVRLNIAGQELELGEAVGAAAIAAQSDDELAQAAVSEGDGQSDVAQIRRDAVEAVMTSAAHWGWSMGQMGFRNPPDPSIQWSDDGQPRIQLGSANPVGPGWRRAALRRNLGRWRNERPPQD